MVFIGGKNFNKRLRKVLINSVTRKKKFTEKVCWRRGREGVNTVIHM